MIDPQNPVSTALGKVYQHIEVLLIPLAILLVPVKGIVVSVLLFILLDTMTGIWKAMKVRQALFTSRGLSEIIPKSIIYITLIIVVYFLNIYIVDVEILGIEFVLTKLAALILIGIEIVSINENFKAVKGISLLEAFNGLVKTLKGMISRVREVIDEFKKIDK